MSIEDTKDFKDLFIKCLTKDQIPSVLEQLDNLSPEMIKGLLNAVLQANGVREDFTPPAKWLVLGKDDPHGSLYSSSMRSRIAMGDWTDDMIGNALYLMGDSLNEPERSLSRAISGIGVLTAGKERIRWLSRRVTFLEKAYMELRPRMYTVKNGDTLYDIAKRETGDGERWRELHELNRHIPNPDRIKAGDSLMYPETWLKIPPM